MGLPGQRSGCLVTLSSMATFTLPPVTEELLTAMVSRIVELFHPEKVILFGSRVWGTPHANSDVDLLVIMRSDLSPARRSAEIGLACCPFGWAVDFIVKTPDKVEHRVRIGDPFLKRVLDRGRVLYAE